MNVFLLKGPLGGEQGGLVLPTLLFISILLGCQVASAQRPIYEGAASAGTGLSFGQGDGTAVMLMSPAYVDFDVIYYNSERPKTELVVGLQAELQGRVSVGVVPQLRMTTARSPGMWYGLVGVPLVVAPFVLLGVEAGVGYLYRLNGRTGIFGEVVADLFFLGSDIIDNGALVQTDFNAGVRIMF